MVKEAEAATVRLIFARYLALGCVARRVDRAFEAVNPDHVPTLSQAELGLGVISVVLKNMR